MRRIAILSLLLFAAPVLAQEPNAQDDFCKACVDPEAPRAAPAPSDEELRAAERERAAVDDAAKRDRIHRLKLAGGLLLGLGTAATPIAAGLELGSISQGLGCLFNSNPACLNTSNALGNAAIGMFAVGVPMVIAGITLLAVATHEKKGLGPPDTVTTPARDLVSSLGVAPIASNGTTTGGVLQWSLNF